MSNLASCQYVLSNQLAFCLKHYTTSSKVVQRKKYLLGSHHRTIYEISKTVNLSHTAMSRFFLPNNLNIFHIFIVF